MRMYIIATFLLLVLSINFLPVKLGVKVLGIGSITIGLRGLFPFLVLLVSWEVFLDNLQQILILAVLGVSFIVSGIALLNLKCWAPKFFLSTVVFLLLYVCIFSTSLSLPGGLESYLKYFIFYGTIGFLLFLLPLFIYFSRSKVKAQFYRQQMRI